MKESLTVSTRIKKVVTCSIDAWVSQRAASKGAALAFYTLFSMAPMLVLVIAIAGAVFGAQAAQGEIFAQLRDLVGASGAQAIQSLLAGARNPASGAVATAIATVVLAIGATTVFSELKDSLDEIWEVPRTRSSGLMAMVHARLLSFGLIFVLAFLLLVSLVISAALAVLERYWSGLWKDAAVILSPLSSVFSFCVIAALFASIYKMLPQIRLSWRDVMIGSVGTAALFTVGKKLIGLYLGNSAIANSFGAAGSVAALLLWIYYSAQIFFFGAEFTRQYALWFGSLRFRNQ